MKQEERDELREVLQDTLLISDMQVIGAVIVSDEPPPRGIWVELNGIACFLGSTPEAAKITVEIGDCWNEGRDGELQAADIEWFDRRGQLGTQWKQEETPLQEQNRRVRVQLNLAWVDGSLDPDFYETTSRTNHEILQHPDDKLTAQCLNLEFVSVKGWNGLWALDEDLEFLKRVVTFSVQSDRYIVQLGEKREAEPGLVLSKKWELERENDSTIVELRMFDGDERNPMMVFRNDGEDNLFLKELDGA